MVVFEILAVLERNKRNIDTPEVLEARPFAATPAAGIVTPNISALCHECHSFPTLLTDRIPSATIESEG